MYMKGCGKKESKEGAMKVKFCELQVRWKHCAVCIGQQRSPHVEKFDDDE